MIDCHVMSCVIL